MKTIFECETQIGSCEYDTTTDHPYGESGDWAIYAHTAASLSASKGMLKIEHRCYLRLGNEVPDQPWVKPEVLLEPAPECELEIEKFVQQLHEQFIERSRLQILEGCLV